MFLLSRLTFCFIILVQLILSFISIDIRKSVGYFGRRLSIFIAVFYFISTDFWRSKELICAHDQLLLLCYCHNDRCVLESMPCFNYSYRIVFRRWVQNVRILRIQLVRHANHHEDFLLGRKFKKKNLCKLFLVNRENPCETNIFTTFFHFFHALWCHWTIWINYAFVVLCYSVKFTSVVNKIISSSFFLSLE